MMADIFVSYKKEDRHWAHDLVTALEKEGWTVWWDIRLNSGEIFDKKIERELAVARCVVVLWSRASVESEWVRAEAEFGRRKGILSPANIENVAPPLQFSLLQTRDLTAWNRTRVDQQYQRFVEDIKIILRTDEQDESISEHNLNSLPAIYANELGMDFVLIKPGSFTMGEAKPALYKHPIHVGITKPFYLGKYPVTQGQWEEVMGQNPSRYKHGIYHPVEMVSWIDVQVYIENLNNSGKITYRLPTEAEWEFACRAGTSTRFFFGNDPKNIDQYVVCRRSFRRHAPIGSKKPNPWGLYDMLGNVNEWVADWYSDTYSGYRLINDPEGPSTGTHRVYRGGAYYESARIYQDCIYRYYADPSESLHHTGFRLVAIP